MLDLPTYIRHTLIIPSKNFLSYLRVVHTLSWSRYEPAWPTPSKSYEIDSCCFFLLCSTSRHVWLQCNFSVLITPATPSHAKYQQKQGPISFGFCVGKFGYCFIILCLLFFAWIFVGLPKLVHHQSTKLKELWTCYAIQCSLHNSVMCCTCQVPVSVSLKTHSL